jgi:formyltetrahydrofolate deformylase
VAEFSNYIASHGGNILSLNEHVDTNEGLFFLRVAWDMKNFIIQPEYLVQAFEPMAQKHNARWEIKYLEI